MLIFEFSALCYLKDKTKIVTQPVDGDSCPANFHSHVTHKRMVNCINSLTTFSLFLSSFNCWLRGLLYLVSSIIGCVGGTWRSVVQISVRPKVTLSRSESDCFSSNRLQHRLDIARALNKDQKIYNVGYKGK